MHLNTIRKILEIANYKITKVIKHTKEEMHLKLEPYQNNIAQCSGCGRGHLFGHHSSIEAIVEDLPISEKRVFLHITKRRYRCPEDDTIRTEEIPWLRKNSRITKRYEKQINRLTAITTNQEAGWFLGLNDEKVYRADKACLEQKAKEVLTPTPVALNMSVDEVSYRKYYRYLTIIIDTDKKKVIWNADGRKSEVLDKYYLSIGKENCEKIESVAMDGARTYISSTSKHAVNAMIVLDKFHVVAKLNSVVDAVRKQELRKARANEDEELINLIGCKQRFVLLRKKSNRTKKHQRLLDRMCEINEPIFKAMLLKESFLNLYTLNLDNAKEHLDVWIKEAKESSLTFFNDLADSFERKKEYLLNWFKKKISSAISEGFNNKIKRLKRMAYGYRDINYFRLKIHQHCGLLNPRIAT